MAHRQQVTVDKSYFDALLRRADFVSARLYLLCAGLVQPATPSSSDMPLQHTRASSTSQSDLTNVTISKIEYDSLLRCSHQLDVLKSALFAGGMTVEAVDLLTSGTGDHLSSQECTNASSNRYSEYSPACYNNPNPDINEASVYSNAFADIRNGVPRHYSFTFSQSPTSGQYTSQLKLDTPQNSRQVSSRVIPSSVPEDFVCNGIDSLADDGNSEIEDFSQRGGTTCCTLYFAGFNGRTSYRDLLSAIKGGPVLNINMPSERSATVTFLRGATDFLSWVKRNDLYVNGKRIEVKWADRQFHLNSHVCRNIANGATRNIAIREALEKGLTAQQIREDMEHIHGLIIIDIASHGPSLFVSTNSVHNALFARTCMLSRSAYRGCKIEFYPDECDVPLPVRVSPAQPISQVSNQKKSFALSDNRYDVLKLDSTDTNSDEENMNTQDNLVGDLNSDEDEDDDEETDDDTVHIRPRSGVRLPT